MKRLTPRFRKWLEHRQRSALRRHRPYLHALATADPSPDPAQFSLQFYFQPDVIGLRAPKNLSFSENYDEVVEFFEAMRQMRLLAATYKAKFLEVDFATIEKVGAAAALCLVSELHRWQCLRGKKLRTVKLEEWKPEVLRLLSEMGFFDVLEVDLPEALQVPQDADQWIRFRSGTNNDGDLAKQIRLELERIREPFPYRQALYEALTEAIANAIEHAYPDDAPVSILQPKVGKRWWAAGAIEPESGRVRVTFYDHGMTIPGSLPRKKFWEKVRGFMTTQWFFKDILNDDGDMIAAAMKYRRSATGETHRGHGMANLQRLAEQSPDSSLRIISRRGYYQWTQKDGDMPQKKDRGISGTLIEWNLFLRHGE